MKCPKCKSDKGYDLKVGWGAGRWIQKCWSCDYNSDTFDSNSAAGQDAVASALKAAGINRRKSGQELREDRGDRRDDLIDAGWGQK